MRRRERRRRNRIFKCLVFSFVAILLVSYAMIWVHRNPNSFSYKSSALLIGSQWVDSEGVPTEIGSFDHSESYSTVIDGKNISHRDLCFRSKNTDFVVYLDGEEIYRYEPDVPRLFGNSYGVYFHAIPIPDYEGEKTITIDVYPAYSGGNGSIQDMQLQYGNKYYAQLYASNAFNFLISIFLFAMGVVLFIGGFAVSGSANKGKEMISIGLFTMLASTWSSTETVYYQLSSNNPAAVHFLNYISLILIPGAAMLFVGHFVRNGKSLIVRTMVLLSAAICAADIIITLSGVTDYHNLLILTHIQLGVAAVLSSFYIIRAIVTSTIRRHQTIVIGTAFFMVIIGGVCDLVRYYVFSSSHDTATFFRLGLFAFVSTMSVYEIVELYNFRKYETEAKTMRKLAHTDALTGIANRMAYNEFEKEIKGNKEYTDEVLLVQLDINNVKKVNDNFGHVEGDKHIAAAASIIDDSFSGIGKVFRTGGDEFIAAIEGMATKARYDDAITKMERAVAEYNKKNKPPIPLQIAYGMAEFNPRKSTPEETLRIADSKMYDMKNKMKGQK